MTVFEKLFDGLKLYEVISLFCGSLLFIVALIILCILVAQRRSIKPIALFFGIAAILLVWPSIQKFNVESLGASIETKTEAYAKNPSPENKQAIENTIDALKDKGVKNPEVVADIANAQYAIGNNKQAEQTIISLPPETQNSSKIAELKKSILVSTALKKQIQVVSAQPTDTAALEKLKLIQEKAKVLPVKSTAVELNISLANKKISSFRAGRSASEGN
ncbi:hypothetical protein ACVWYG_000069 [Pedobacter sp. UYEF25]